MNKTRIVAIIWRHYFEAIHNFDRITEIIYWPILDIIVWGFLTIYLTQSYNTEYGIVSFILGAVILWGTFYAIQRDLAIGFLDELWSRNLLNLFSSPLTIWEYITGLIIVNFAKISFGLIMSALLAWALYSFNIFPFALGLLPYFANLILFSLAIGIMITGLIFRYTTKIQALAWSFAGILQPISCVFYPLSVLPKFLQYIAILLPSTHSFEGMRQILAGQGFSFSHFFWGFILNIFYIAIAVIFFKKIFEISKNKGLLVKLE